MAILALVPTAVVTGGAGFLGSHLCEHLLGQGQRVICVDNLETARSRTSSTSGTTRSPSCNHDVIEHIEIDEPVDYVFHLAALASPIDYLRQPLQSLKIGSYGTHNALGLAKWKRARFLLASTSEVYGDPQVHPQPETYWGHVNPIGPRGVYDEAKRYAEALTMAYHNQQGVDTAIVRIFNTYGPRMRAHDGRAIPTFVRQALEGKPLTVFGDGSQTRSFCYLVGERRPRPDQAHLAPHDVPELRQLVQGNTPQHRADPRDPWIATVDRPARALPLGADDHRPQLHELELAPVLPDPLLSVEDRPSAVELDRDRGRARNGLASTSPSDAPATSSARFTGCPRSAPREAAARNARSVRDRPASPRSRRSSSTRGPRRDRSRNRPAPASSSQTSCRRMASR